MRAELLTCKKYLVYFYLRLRRILRLHLESSLKVSKEDTEVLVSRLRKTSPTRELPQIKDGYERKIVNFKNKCAASRTLKDLPMLVANPQDHWFDNNIEGMGGGMKKSSSSYYRLQALASHLQSVTANDVDNQSSAQVEHA